MTEPTPTPICNEGHGLTEVELRAGRMAAFRWLAWEIRRRLLDVAEAREANEAAVSPYDLQLAMRETADVAGALWGWIVEEESPFSVEPEEGEEIEH